MQRPPTKAGLHISAQTQRVVATTKSSVSQRSSATTEPSSNPLELNTRKCLNVSASGCFYEKASSRRARHRAALASHATNATALKPTAYTGTKRHSKLLSVHDDAEDPYADEILRKRALKKSKMDRGLKRKLPCSRAVLTEDNQNSNFPKTTKHTKVAVSRGKKQTAVNEKCPIVRCKTRPTTESSPEIIEIDL